MAKLVMLTSSIGSKTENQEVNTNSATSKTSYTHRLMNRPHHLFHLSHPILLLLLHLLLHPLPTNPLLIIPQIQRTRFFPWVLLLVLVLLQRLTCCWIPLLHPLTNNNPSSTPISCPCHLFSSRCNNNNNNKLLAVVVLKGL